MTFDDEGGSGRKKILLMMKGEESRDPPKKDDIIFNGPLHVVYWDLQKQTSRINKCSENTYYRISKLTKMYFFRSLLLRFPSNSSKISNNYIVKYTRILFSTFKMILVFFWNTQICMWSKINFLMKDITYITKTTRETW